jgi:putative transposase
MTNVFALVRLLPMSDRDKDAEILALRHQITVLERQLGTIRPRFSPADRAFLAALLHRLPRGVLGRFRLLIRPDTVLRWHRDLLARRHAARSRPGRPGRPLFPDDDPHPAGQEERSSMPVISATEAPSRASPSPSYA